jgi:hypothetical protein
MKLMEDISNFAAIIMSGGMYIHNINTLPFFPCAGAEVIYFYPYSTIFCPSLKFSSFSEIWIYTYIEIILFIVRLFL